MPITDEQRAILAELRDAVDAREPGYLKIAAALAVIDALLRKLEQPAPECNHWYVQDFSSTAGGSRCLKCGRFVPFGSLD